MKGCKEAGAKIFANPVIQQIAEQHFVPAAFNTWDRNDGNYAKAFRQWSAGLAGS